MRQKIDAVKRAETSKYEKLTLAISVVSLAVSALVAALSLSQGSQENVLTQEAFTESSVQSRIANCLALASFYAGQGQAVPQENGLPNATYQAFADKSLFTARGLALCQVRSASAEQLTECVLTDVNSSNGNKVLDTSSDGSTATNLIC
ncbi:hypothetical protein [Cypionkella sinensis]|uniref:Uncharacterized protein n=1 Tax=Cypionkella sinensis TaxID=1756043 RepID=A0ABV7J6H1_9RHOB